MYMMFNFSLSAPDIAHGSTMEQSLQLTSSESLEREGINTESIRASAENFSFGKAIQKIEDISFHMLILWLLISGILFFFTVKWAIRLSVLGIIGFTIILYHEQILGMMLGLVDWIVSVA